MTVESRQQSIIKSQIKDEIHRYLYGSVMEQLNKRVDLIIYKNAAILKHSHMSFNYCGEFYSCDLNKAPRIKQQLDISLHTIMEEYIKDATQLDEEESPYVMGYINQVLNSSINATNYLFLLPDALHQTIKSFYTPFEYSPDWVNNKRNNDILANNQAAISMIKQRLVLNLIM